MDANPIQFDANYLLLKRAQKGDKAAASKFVENVSPRLFRVAFRILNNSNDAEEMTQECLLKIWQNFPKWESGRALIETWAYRVITNLCFDKLKQKSRLEIDDLSEDFKDDYPNAEIALLNRDLKNQIDMALATLPARQRAVVILFYFEGLGQKQISETLQTSVEAIESLLARAKNALKQKLCDTKGENLDTLSALNQGLG